VDDNEKRELKNLIEREVFPLLGMGYAPDDKKYPNFRVSKVMGPQWPDYEYVDWPHYSVTMQVVARPKPDSPENARAKGTHLSLVRENKKMKLSKAKLKQIIKEEISKVLSEANMSDNALKKLLSDLSLGNISIEDAKNRSGDNPDALRWIERWEAQQAQRDQIEEPEFEL